MEEMKFISPTNGQMTKNEIYQFLLDKIKENQITKNHDYSIIVGTDSQNFYKTKMVLVICLIDKGHGGRYFYHIDWLNKIKDVNTKIYTETEKSLEIAKELNTYLHENGMRAEVEVHVDIGRNGKTKDLIQGILGWITAEGFKAKIKDESWVASTIADKISK